MQKQDELGVRFGKYQVFSKLAVGGMAELFLAKQPGIGGFRKTVVLKCILPHLAQEDDFVAMFLDEARVVAPLDHPNIVQIYEIGEEEGVYYISMEYIRGQTLKEFRKKLYRQNPDVKPYRLSAGIIAQAASGLHHAHVARDDDGTPLHLVHRDVSPTNLIISYNGVVKLVDFGVAKASNQQHQTSAGTIKGKYRYMSPEQIRGHELDGRSDVFSLGIVLYELSTNAALFGRRHEAEIIDAVRNARVPAPSKFRPDYPEALEHIVMKALHSDQSKRYANADDLRSDLERFMRDEGAYYGTTQLAELMRYLFSKEQSEDRTGVVHKPLSPADFVRFLGKEALTNYKDNIQRANSDPSYPAAPAAGSGQWSQSQVSRSSHLSHGHLSSGNAPSYIEQTPSASRSVPPPLPPQAQVPHAEALELPEETRTEIAAMGSETPNERVSELDLAPITPLSPVTLPPGTGQHTHPGPSTPAGTPQKGRSRSSTLLFALLFVLLGAGGVTTYFLVRSQKSSNTELTRAQQRQIEGLLQKKQYVEASATLGSIKQGQLTPAQSQWFKKMEQAIRVGPQIDAAEKLYDQEQYAACVQMLAALQKQAPTDRRLATLLQEARAKLLASKNIPVLPRRRQSPPDRRVLQPRPRPNRVRRRRRRRRRRWWRRRRRRVVPRPRVRIRPRVPTPSLRLGRLYLNSSPRSRVSIDGTLVGFTPINGKRITAGTHEISFQHKDYITSTRTLSVGDKAVIELNVTLKPRRVAPRQVLPPIRPRVRPKPRPRGRQADLPFSAVRLPRRKRLRIYISDPRGLAGRHSTLKLKQLARQIERETQRLLGSKYRVSGITRYWQRTVRQQATSRNQDYHTFYPRAVAYTIYRAYLRGRRFKRITQLLVKYEYRNRFKRIRK